MEDFWTLWYGLYQMIAPLLADIANEYAGTVKIIKVNTDENSIAKNYNVMSLPTIISFKNGKVVDQIIGTVPKQVKKEKINYFAYDTTAMLNYNFVD